MATPTGIEQRHAPESSTASGSHDHPPPISMDDLIQSVIESSVFPINAHQSGKGSSDKDSVDDVPMEGVCTAEGGVESGGSLAVEGMDLSELGAESGLSQGAVLAALKSLVEVMGEQEQRRQLEEALGLQQRQGEQVWCPVGSWLFMFVHCRT